MLKFWSNKPQTEDIPQYVACTRKQEIAHWNCDKCKAQHVIPVYAGDAECQCGRKVTFKPAKLKAIQQAVLDAFTTQKAENDKEIDALESAGTDIVKLKAERLRLEAEVKEAADLVAKCHAVVVSDSTPDGLVSVAEPIRKEHIGAYAAAKKNRDEAADRHDAHIQAYDIATRAAEVGRRWRDVREREVLLARREAILAFVVAGEQMKEMHAALVEAGSGDIWLPDGFFSPDANGRNVWMDHVLTQVAERFPDLLGDTLSANLVARRVAERAKGIPVWHPVAVRWQC